MLRKSTLRKTTKMSERMKKYQFPHLVWTSVDRKSSWSSVIWTKTIEPFVLTLINCVFHFMLKAHQCHCKLDWEHVCHRHSGKWGELRFVCGLLIFQSDAVMQHILLLPIVKCCAASGVFWLVTRNLKTQFTAQFLHLPPSRWNVSSHLRGIMIGHCLDNSRLTFSVYDSVLGLVHAATVGNNNKIKLILSLWPLRFLIDSWSSGSVDPAVWCIWLVQTSHV